MNPVHRVIIRDQQPVFRRAAIDLPVNRAVLVAAAISLVVQMYGVVQAIQGLGNQVGWFEHVLWAFVAFLWLFLGILVFLQRCTQPAGRLFLLSSSAGAMWLGVGTMSGVNALDAFLFSAGLLLFPPLLFSFARAYTGQRDWRRAELLLYLPPLLLIVPTTHDYIAGPKSFLWKLAILTIPAYLLAAIVRTTQDMYAETAPERQAQLRALVFGLVAGTVPGVFAFAVPLTVRATPPVDTGWLPALVLMSLVAMSYSVLLFEFSEADLIVRRGVVYGVLTLAIVAMYAALGSLLTASGASVQNPGGGLAFVAVTVVIGGAFVPLQRATRRLVDWLLYGQRMDRWHALQAFSERLATVMQPDELGAVLVQEIAVTLHLRGAFLLRRESTGVYRLRHRITHSSSSRAPLDDDGTEIPALSLHAALGDPPTPLLLVHGRPMRPANQEFVAERYRVLDDLGVALAIPLSTRFGLEGVLCLQGKQAHDAIDSDDIELLMPVIRQASAALDNALLFVRLEEKVEELRHAYVRIAGEQEAERARLARELHDGTAQELANLITLATVAERQMNGETASRSTLDRLRRQAEEAYQGVRRASYALRPVMLDDFGLEPTLERYLEGFEESAGIRVTYLHTPGRVVPHDAELALFRVAQECMENVRKHSGASEVHVTLARVDGHVQLEVQDDGRGMPEDATRGIGLAGMRERIEAVGGELEILTHPGDGVVVRARVPVETSNGR